ncbi:MAG: PAS domain S-box protein, partial [Gemmatimonadaceae bacterium]|nr:PAS domain S-box protein [Gemmatimonadaceae bacterium]
MPSPRPWVIAAAGALATLLLLAIHVALDRTVGPTPHFVLLFTLPVLLAAWWGGAGPGLSTLAVSGLVLGVHGVTAQGEPALLYHADPERLGLFVLIGLLIVATFSQLHRAQSAAARSARVMRAQLDTVVRIASEREAVERQLAEGQARQQALIEALPQLIWTCRDDGWCDYLSPQWIAYTGIPEAEQLGYGWAKAVHPDDRQAVLEAWDRAVQHAATFDVTFRIRSGAGAYRWFKTRAVQVMAADGTRTWFGTNTDIHDLRSAEEALRSLTRTLEERVEERTRALRTSEQRFRAIFHAQFQFIGLLSPDGILLEANQTALAAVGATADQVLGRPFDETAWWIHDAQQQERLRDAMRRAAAGEQVRFESNHPPGDGSTIWLDIPITPFHDEQGQVVLLIPEGRDITARKASERALQLQEERFRSAFEHAPIGFAPVSPDGRWLRVNEALCQLVGHDEDSLLATTFQPITHPD